MSMTLEAALKKLDELTKERDTISTQNKELSQKLETQALEYTAALEFKQKVVEDLKKEVTRLANIIGGGKLKTSHELLIKQADYTALQALEKEFREETEKMFPLQCSDCGSKNVQRRSSIELTVSLDQTEPKPGFKTIH